jgi:hypothetical protein
MLGNTTAVTSFRVTDSMRASKAAGHVPGFST